MARTFVDTNVLAYTFDDAYPSKRARAMELVDSLWTEGDLVVSTQVLQELFVTLTRKLETTIAPAVATDAVERLSDDAHVVLLDVPLVLAAMHRSRRSQISLWDALIVGATLEARCTELLTEDLQDGWQVGEATVINPFRGL